MFKRIKKNDFVAITLKLGKDFRDILFRGKKTPDFQYMIDAMQYLISKLKEFSNEINDLTEQKEAKKIASGCPFLIEKAISAVRLLKVSISGMEECKKLASGNLYKAYVAFREVEGDMRHIIPSEVDSINDLLDLLDKGEPLTVKCCVRGWDPSVVSKLFKRVKETGGVHITTRDSHLRFLDGGFLLYVTIVSLAANFAALTDFFYKHFVQKSKREKTKERGMTIIVGDIIFNKFSGSQQEFEKALREEISKARLSRQKGR